NSFLPGEETQASVGAQTFLDWWDSHYDEIASFEPQYQRLNEIMKWSLLFGWSHRAQAATQFSFLSNAEVHDKRYWFPDWVKTQKGLRFTKWGDSKCPPGTSFLQTQDFASVRFYPRGYKGSETEALPLLSSKFFQTFGRIASLMGGVSLADS